jgi:O-antigen/teichoic acid export membrane protein
LENLGNKILTGLTWTGSAQIIQQTIQFASAVILARLLPPESFGLLGMAMVFTGLATLLGDFGLGSALIQRRDLGERHINSVFWFCALAGLSMTALLVLSAPLITQFYHQPTLRPVVMAAGCAALPSALRVVPMAILQRQMKFRLLALTNALAISGSSGLAVLLAYCGAGIWSLVAQVLSLTVLSTLLAWLFAAWRPRCEAGVEALRELSGFSRGVLGFSFVNYWSRNADNMLVGKFLGAEALGFYGRAYQLMLLPVSLITATAAQVMFPALSQVQNDLPRLRRIYIEAVEGIAMIAFPLMIGLLVTAEPFIRTIFSDKWLPAVPVLRLLCLVGLEQSVTSSLGWLFTASGHTDLFFKFGVFAAGAAVISFAIGLHWGIAGVATAYAVCDIGLLWYPAMRLAGGTVGLKPTDILRPLRPIFAAAAMMGGCVWLIASCFPQTPSRQLIMQVTLGAFIYLFLLMILRVPAWQRVWTRLGM